MESEKFNKACLIADEIDELRRNLKDLDGGHWDKVQIRLKTGYSDMGLGFERSTTFGKEMSKKIRNFIKVVVNDRIKDLEREFENL